MLDFKKETRNLNIALIREANVTAKITTATIEDLNKACKSLIGERVIIPAGINHPLNKFAGREGVIRNPQFTQYGGPIHAIVDIFYLDGSGRIADYPESKYFVAIDETWFAE